MRTMVFACVITISLPTFASTQDGAKSELEGRWNVKSFEVNDASPQLLRMFHGLKANAKQPKQIGYLNVQGEKAFPLGRDKLLRESLIKTNADKKPKTIDFSGTERFLKGMSFPGIYKIEGDELTLCVSEGDTRPTEFQANAGQVLIRYERQKAN